MPVYESVQTGNRVEMDEFQARSYKPGVWKLVSDVSNAEARAKALDEALQNKVDIEQDGNQAQEPVGAVKPTGKKGK